MFSYIFLITVILNAFTSVCKAQVDHVTDYPFEIRIIDKYGEPVKNATVRGGFDWTDYTAYTNNNGIAKLPEVATQYSMFIYSNNYFPLYDSIGTQREFILRKTPRFFDSIGVVLGNAVVFNDKEIVTLDYIGTYRVYQYNEFNVKNVLSISLSDSVKAITHTELYSNTLWISTHSSGIYSFNVSDIHKPKLISHYAVDGIINYFLIKDEFIIVSQANYIHVLATGKENDYKEIQNIPSKSVSNSRERQSLKINGNYLIHSSFKGSVSIYDISNPYSYKLIWSEEIADYKDVLFYKNYLIRQIKTERSDWSGKLQYDVMNIQNPAQPVKEKPFFCTAQIKGFTTDNCAYGFWFGDHLFTIADGTINKGFNITGVYAQEGYQTGYEELGGVHHPYYMFKGKLLKLD